MRRKPLSKSKIEADDFRRKLFFGLRTSHFTLSRPSVLNLSFVILVDLNCVLRSSSSALCGLHKLSESESVQ